METNLGLPNKRTGKVRDIYDVQQPNGERALLIVATDRVSAFDVVLANGPRWQGCGAHADIEVLVRPLRRRHRPPSDLHGSGRRAGAERCRTRTARRARHAVPRGAGFAGGVHRPRLSGGQRLEGLPEQRRSVRHRIAGGSRQRRPPARTVVHAVHQGGHRPRREHQLRRRRRRRGRGNHALAQGEDLAALRLGAGTMRSSAASCWPTRSSNSARWRTATSPL